MSTPDPNLSIQPAPEYTVDAADHREAQLAAFKHTGLRRYGYSFQQALESPALAICLRNTAFANVKKLAGATS